MIPNLIQMAQITFLSTNLHKLKYIYFFTGFHPIDTVCSSGYINSTSPLDLISRLENFVFNKGVEK